MQIHGFNKTTLLDYPEHIATTIFTGGCNFRCPFCHNVDLVLNPGTQVVIPEEEVFTHLKKRCGILEGVCITGGEPTLQKDLPDFIRKVKELGYLVKLDTNGYRPDILEELLDANLLDYVAMDIKASPGNYSRAAGLSKFDIGIVEKSVETLKGCGIPYEFRTTVVKGIHSVKEFELIGEWIAGSRAYYLQAFRGTEKVLAGQESDTSGACGFSSFTRVEMEEMAALARKYIKKVELRGID